MPTDKQIPPTPDQIVSHFFDSSLEETPVGDCPTETDLYELDTPLPAGFSLYRATRGDAHAYVIPADGRLSIPFIHAMGETRAKELLGDVVGIFGEDVIEFHNVQNANMERIFDGFERSRPPNALSGASIPVLVGQWDPDQ